MSLKLHFRVLVDILEQRRICTGGFSLGQEL